MRTPILYGLFMALAFFLVTLVLFLAGAESDPGHMTAARVVGSLLDLAIAIGFIVAGIRSRRRAAPAPFTYGQAFGAGFLVQLFSSLFGLVTTYVFYTFINPGFIDKVVQMNLDKMADRGLSPEQMDRSEKMIRMFSNPIAFSVGGFAGTLVIGILICLIAAAFLARTDPAAPPAESA